MRQALKLKESLIVIENLKYPNSSKKIRDILLQEQSGFCAYTEEYLGRADAADIDHFNPTLKNKPDDNYNNWFLVKHQWNNEKSNKWLPDQAVLHPTAIDFETRIIYSSGDYIAARIVDSEAENLIKLLKLDDPGLADQRKRYIKRKKDELEISAMTKEDFFKELATAEPRQVLYPRAIREEFGVDIYEYF
jgi:HNH endonuclease